MTVIRWLTLPRLIAAIAILGVLAIAFRAPVDTDTYWHLRAGQWQVEHRAVLSADVFSSTREGQHWVNVHWLAQIILYGMYALVGDFGLALFTALLAVCGMIFVYRICEGDPLIRAASVLLGAATAAVFWAPRSQMLSFFFASVVVYLLWQYQKKGVDRLWIIPAIMIPWANSHGGYAIGFVLLALAIIGELVQAAARVTASRSEGIRPSITLLNPVIRLVIVGLVSAVAVLINPFGIDTLLLPFRTVGIGVLREFIQEWAAPNFHLPQVLPFGLMMVGTSTVVGLSSRRLDIRDAVMLAGTSVMALLAGRNISTFALVAAPVLSAHLASLLADHKIVVNSSRIRADGVFLAINWLLLLLVIFGVVIRAAYEISPLRLDKSRRDILPVGAVQHLKDNNLPREVFNSYNWGGYLIWEARDYLVFVDGRTDLYDDAFVREYVNIYVAGAGWAEELDKVHVNTVLVETASPLAKILERTPGWKKDYSDTLATIYVRETPVEAQP